MLCNSRNSTHIRNPLIFQEKSLLPHVCAGQQVRTLILQAGTNSDLLTLISCIIGYFLQHVIKKKPGLREFLQSVEEFLKPGNYPIYIIKLFLWFNNLLWTLFCTLATSGTFTLVNMSNIVLNCNSTKFALLYAHLTSNAANRTNLHNILALIL